MKTGHKRKLKNKGFTLAELIMAMWVMAIILTAVASLAFALGVANDSADDTAEFQSRLRFTTLRISDLVKNSRLICAAGGNNVAIWRNDDNGDAKINAGEIVYIEYNNAAKKIRLLEFEPLSYVANLEISINSIENGNFRVWIVGKATLKYTDLMVNCSGMLLNVDVETPFSRKLAIKLLVQRAGNVEIYEINSTLRCYAGHLLNASGEIVSDDDE